MITAPSLAGRFSGLKLPEAAMLEPDLQSPDLPFDHLRSAAPWTSI
jgi:hypothetical protein